jgi:hypothetical protein
MKTAKQRATIGDRKWQVEWCAGIPQDENGDSDMDAADYRRSHFKTRDEAIAFAKEKLPLDAFGSVAVCEIEFSPYDEDDSASMPHVGFWEHMRDAEYVSD